MPMRHERTACPGGSPSVRSSAYDSPPITSDSAIWRGFALTRRSIADGSRGISARTNGRWRMVDDGGIDGFAYTTTTVGPTTYRPGVAGDGPPVLLLHGFPQTHYCWHLVAPALLPRNTVVVC